jgi:(2S)-methylsuccinyl-CoA dehydrogenase
MLTANWHYSADTDLSLFVEAADAASTLLMHVRSAIGSRLSVNGRLAGETVDRHQREIHGLAWMATTAEAIMQTVRWAQDSSINNRLAEIDHIAFKIGVGEYLHHLASGIPMSQNEIVRPGEMGLVELTEKFVSNPAVTYLLQHGNTAENRHALIQLVRDGQNITEELNDDTLDMVRQTYRRFTDDRIIPNAHKWHLDDALLPDEILGEMADLGTFGICIDPEYGGLGMGKLAMCVATEELSRGWIAAGSIGTRSEIAGELIHSSGTPEQKARWLSGIASGSVLPTAVFTEPDTGSDLARLRTRASPKGDGSWEINGNKTWITHAGRSDLMTVLARTDPEKADYRGLSMFLVPKSRSTDTEIFPDPWLSGGEIPVLGYRGMREYELSISSCPVEAGGLLGDAEGAGFKQLMQTFEGARIQTAARALGVARRAYELGISYASDRKQFGRPILEFPRVADKLALMVAEILMARQLTYHAARQKDSGKRCDVEAGMAKLLAARVAWSNADLSLQIHGGNGYAQEFEISRILCDARILNIFEGAAEIQAQVIGRGLLSGSNA